MPYRIKKADPSGRIVGVYDATDSYQVRYRSDEEGGGIEVECTKGYTCTKCGQGSVRHQQVVISEPGEAIFAEDALTRKNVSAPLRIPVKVTPIDDVERSQDDERD